MNIVLIRLLHLLGTVMLLGNLMVTGFWALFLYRVRDTVPFRQVARAMLWADLIFTVVGGSLLGVTGFMLIKAQGIPFETSWVIRGATALGLAGFLWIAAIVPLQNRLTRIFADDRRALKRVFVRWIVAVWTVIAVLCYGLVTMVRR